MTKEMPISSSNFQPLFPGAEMPNEGDGSFCFAKQKEPSPSFEIAKFLVPLLLSLCTLWLKKRPLPRLTSNLLIK